jgi:phosphoglycerol transferase
VLRVNRLNLHVPLTYWGDALYFDSWVKGVMEGNWPWRNSHLGMPFGADWRDFPVDLTVEAILIRILALFTSSAGLVHNLVWMIGVVVCAGLAAYSFQRLAIGKWMAAALGIIYALQPFAYYRGVSHFNLMFYLVPLLAAGAVEIAAGRVPGNMPHSSDDRSLSGRARLLATLRNIPAYIYLACLVQGFTYIYYSFFGVFLFVVAALLAYTVYRRRSALIAGSVAVIVICGATLINLTPSLYYWSERGRNPAMAYKSPADAEIYGLKLRHLLTPIPENSFPPLQYIQKKLDGAGFIGENENATSRLGSIGSFGLLFLLAYGLVSCLRRGFKSDRPAGVLEASSALTLACLLLATVGAFGSLFNVFVAPDIRGYNRIVVFIDFFSIAAVGVLLTRASGWYLRRRWPKPLMVCALAAIVIFGISDQAVTAEYRKSGPRETQFDLDGAYVKSVESALPRNASVFQLPFTDFPAEGPPFRMGIYDHSRAYLHSHTLRWTWGAMSGRISGEWVRQTSNLPVKDMLARVSAAGFSGIWLDRFGYQAGSSPEPEIKAVLGREPLLRSDGRIAFYDLTEYSKRLKASETPREFRLAEQDALNAVVVTYPTGFYGEERNNGQTWRWSSQHGVMQLHNPLPQPRTVALAMMLETGGAGDSLIRISASGKSDTVALRNNSAPYAREIQLPARGTVNISFDCDCTPISAPADPRTLFFELTNLKVMQREH